MASKKTKRELTTKQRKYVQERMNGADKKNAALKAGYAPSVASKAGAKVETPHVREHFRELLGNEINPAHVVQRLAEGLDAEETRVVITGRKGEEQVDVQALPDMRERREAVRLYSQLMGLLDPKLQVGVETKDTSLLVVIEHVGA